MKTQMEMPLLVTGTFQKQIELMVQLNLQCKKDKPPYKKLQIYYSRSLSERKGNSIDEIQKNVSVIFVFYRAKREKNKQEFYRRGLWKAAFFSCVSINMGRMYF